LKIKAIATSPQLPLEISKPAVVSTDAAALNVHARLCNSNPVKEAFPTAIAEVKREFGILDDGASAKRRVRAKDHAAAAGSGSRGHSQDESDEGGEEDALRLRAVQKGNSAKRVDRDILMADVDGSGESGSDDEDEFDRYADRLAGSDDNDDDDEDMHDASSDVDIEDLEQQLEREGIQRKALRPRPHDHAAARSLSDSPSPSPPPDRDGPTRPAPATRKPTTSAFLPILSMAGYISGGSGSDADDFEDVRPKKNRRGQRARQAIWEKKFGAGAKHLETQTAKQGWDPKRGAVAVAGGDARPLNRAAKRSAGSRFAKDANKLPLGRSRASVARQPEAKASIATGGPRERKGPVAAAKAAKPTRDDSGPLHPSWEAARRAKEKKSVPVTFQGKKISFD
jgi:plasmid stability protein